MTQEFIHFHPTGSNACESDMRDEELVAEGWFCVACRSPKPETGAIEIRITENRPPFPPISSVHATGVNLARRDFLYLFGEENVARDLMLGTLYGPDNKPIKDWVTWRGQHRVVIRGTDGKGYTGPGHKYVGYRYCEACGNLHYNALGHRYLSPEPEADAQLFESDLSGLVVSAGFADKLGIMRQPRFGIERLKVLDPAPDGYGNFD